MYMLHLLYFWFIYIISYIEGVQTGTRKTISCLLETTFTHFTDTDAVPSGDGDDIYQLRIIMKVSDVMLFNVDTMLRHLQLELLFDDIVAL